MCSRVRVILKEDKVSLPYRGNDLPITVAALVPASHQSEIEQDSVSAPRPSNVDEVVASEVRAQALKAELGKANIKLEEARRYKEQAERAREQLEVEASETLRTERQRLTEDADKAKQQLDEAKALKAELAKAKDDAKKLLRLIDALEDNEDVQSVYSNYDIPDEWIEELSA